MNDRYLAPTYGRFPVRIVSGGGAVCTDEDGRQYIDFGSGIGVNSLGYCDPGWVAAVTAQAATLNHTSNLYHTLPAAELAELLCLRTGMRSAFFGNSGAEANEGAIKTARKYSHDRYGAGRDRIITLVNSFHGRTVTTLAATGQESFHQHFMPFTQGFDYVPANDLAALEAAVSDNTCAIMLEFIQGEGGVLPLTQAFADLAAQLCREHDLLLIADEVQTGIGRTGKLLCCQHYGAKPDMITLAKGLGGGLPIGCFLLGERTADTLGPGDHGSTFGGNPIVCAGALHVLRELTDTLLAEIADKSQRIRLVLAGIQKVPEISGMGLMLGLKVSPRSARQLAQECLESGLLVLTAKDRLRLLPPLNIPKAELERGLAILKYVLERENCDEPSA